MRNLVLGANGRIGRLLQGLWPVLAPGLAARTDWGMRPRAAGGVGTGAVRGDHAPYGGRTVVADPLGDPAGLAGLMDGAQTLLCLAGVVPGPAAENAVSDNIALGLAAVRAARGTGARVVLVSSAAVYGHGAGRLEEDRPPAPVNAYGRSKAAMEQEAAALAARLNVPLTSLRIGNIAGLDAILGGWRPGFRLDRFDTGRTPARSYIGPVSLARVLADLCEGPGDLPPCLNVAAPDPAGGAVEMGALLDAAGRDWTPQPAPGHAIAEVHFALDRLWATGVTPIPGSATPAALVAEWRAARALGLLGKERS
ncbi:NAD-dependent epimerase/dehydratase family protein [Chachezhania antarctica]|uniref:NAD-dependent epimerase/dehydratase family protein n=1 Tax=Chachezhania antarctica TaxID=2340860 RepID=UPI001F099DF6|nr:NAD(P)-dependent oxidoreductase [Chachezhania antarctica]